METSFIDEQGNKFSNIQTKAKCNTGKVEEYHIKRVNSSSFADKTRKVKTISNGVSIHNYSGFKVLEAARYVGKNDAHRGQEKQPFTDLQNPQINQLLGHQFIPFTGGQNPQINQLLAHQFNPFTGLANPQINQLLAHQFIPFTGLANPQINQLQGHHFISFTGRQNPTNLSGWLHSSAVEG